MTSPMPSPPRPAEVAFTLLSNCERITRISFIVAETVEIVTCSHTLFFLVSMTLENAQKG
jgi:hypothetical protein